MEKLLTIVFTANSVIFFITLLALLADRDARKYLLFPCILSGTTALLLTIFMSTTPLARHVLKGHAVIEYKMQEGNVVDSCYVFKKQ
jgi:hypothetical protein